MWNGSFGRKESVRPGENSGFLQIGIKGPGDEDILNLRQTVLKICSVLLIKVCCLQSGRMCIEVVHGNCRSGMGENACSLLSML